MCHMLESRPSERSSPERGIAIRIQQAAIRTGAALKRAAGLTRIVEEIRA